MSVWMLLQFLVETLVLPALTVLPEGLCSSEVSLDSYQM